MLELPVAVFGLFDHPRLGLGFIITGPRKRGEEGGATNALGAENGADVIRCMNMATRIGIVSAVVPLGVHKSVKRLQDRAATIGG